MRRIAALVAIALVGVLAVALTRTSGATFTDRTTGSGTVAAANDWTAPTVSVDPLGPTVTGTVTVSATAADERSGVASVTIQYLAPGGSAWTTLCTDTTSPYSCSWNTGNGSDGTYSLRATATDAAGYTATSATVSTSVANRLAVTLGDPGDAVRGTVALTATLTGNGTTAYPITIQYADSGSLVWRTLCGPSTATATSYTCSWNTSGSPFTQGSSYDLRAVAGSAVLPTATSTTVTDVMVDNAAPTGVTMTDPGTPLRGTVTLAATATDADSGVAQVLLQYQATGATSWTTACTLTVDPYACRFDTTTLTGGSYAFRAVATDYAGAATTSATVVNRTVDNTVSSVSMDDPGAYVSGTVTLSATVTVPTGVTATSVRIDRAPTGTAAGSTAWTTICTDTTAPYTCSWDTTGLTTGGYDLRAVLVDSTKTTTTSATVTTRVDNTPLRGYDVQATNGGAIAGRLDAGDALTLTYTTQVAPGSVMAGWTGSASPVVLRLRDGAVLGQSSTGDTVDVLGPLGATPLNLGSVNLRGNYIGKNRTATFNATMVATTVTVNGVPATAITLTLGSLASGGSLKTVTSGTMTWTPSDKATDTSGRAGSTATVTERNALDRDF